MFFFLVGFDHGHFDLLFLQIIKGSQGEGAICVQELSYSNAPVTCAVEIGLTFKNTKYI